MIISNTLSQKTLSRQEKINKKYNGNPWPSKKFLSNPVEIIEKYRPTIQLTLAYFLRKETQYERLYMSQQMIADEIGRCVREVNRAIKELEIMGLISTWFRDHNTSFYWVSHCFKLPHLRQKLSFLFPVLTLPILSILLLLSQQPVSAFNQRCLRIFKLASSPVIYNTTTTTYCKKSTYEENSNEVKLRSTQRSTKKDEVVYKKEAMFAQFNFTSQQIEELSYYSEPVLREAVMILNKSPRIQDKFRYLLGICKKLAYKVAQQKLGSGGEVRTGGKVWTQAEPDEVTRKETIKRKEALSKWHYENHSEQYHKEVRQQDGSSLHIVKPSISQAFTDILTDQMKDELCLKAMNNPELLVEHPGLKPILQEHIKKKYSKSAITPNAVINVIGPEFDYNEENWEEIV